MSLDRYQPDHKGTGELLVGPQMHQLMKLAGEAGKAHAISISPDQEPYSAGYIASFETEVSVQMIARSRRATATLTNTSNHAAAVEWQWDHHVLGRTADYLENSWVPGG